MYDDFLGTYDSVHRYGAGSRMRVVCKEGIKSRTPKGTPWIRGGSVGGSFCVVGSVSGDGYVGDVLVLGICSGGHRFYDLNRLSHRPFLIFLRSRQEP